MILLIQTFFMIAAGYYLSTVVREDPGYVLLGIGNYSVETSMAVFIVAAIATIFIAHLLIRLLGYLVFAPSRIGKWRDQRRNKVAATALSRGLLAQAEGKWRQSEKALLTYAKKTESAINYLAAAKSAQAQGSVERMNQYLDMAQETDPNSSTAIRLTQAELLIDGAQYDRATAALTRIRKEDPKNGRALWLMTKLLKKSKNWGKLSELLYDLKRNKVLQPGAFNELEKKVYLELLRKSCESSKLIDVRNTWSIIPKHLQRDTELIAIFAKKLISEGEHLEAEPYIRSGIKQHWDDNLVYLYGLLYTDNPYNELSVAERWYKQQPSNAALLLTLGRLSSRSELWGKARSYLESSVENGGGPEAYHALAQVLEHIDEPELAAEMYRKGLEIASGKGLPELAALTAKKKAKAEALAKKEADRAAAEAEQEEIKALEDKSKEKEMAASAA
ncbi:MAG TPA: hypothetical protein ENK06_08145 [Gammaproteobacteria bacterium]|nr:hypothetical protein [Gammaproteobacteria bacterium]